MSHSIPKVFSFSLWWSSRQIAYFLKRHLETQTAQQYSWTHTYIHPDYDVKIENEGSQRVTFATLFFRSVVFAYSESNCIFLVEARVDPIRWDSDNGEFEPETAATRLQKLPVTQLVLMVFARSRAKIRRPCCGYSVSHPCLEADQEAGASQLASCPTTHLLYKGACVRFSKPGTTVDMDRSALLL